MYSYFEVYPRYSYSKSYKITPRNPSGVPELRKKHIQEGEKAFKKELKKRTETGNTWIFVNRITKEELRLAYRPRSLRLSISDGVRVWRTGGGYVYTSTLPNPINVSVEGQVGQFGYLEMDRIRKYFTKYLIAKQNEFTIYDYIWGQEWEVAIQSADFPYDPTAVNAKFNLSMLVFKIKRGFEYVNAKALRTAYAEVVSNPLVKNSIMRYAPENFTLKGLVK